MNIILYHDKCIDGLFAAYCCYLAFGDTDAVYIAVNYNETAERSPLKALQHVLNKHEKYKNYPNKSSLLSQGCFLNNDSITYNGTSTVSFKDINLYIVDYSLPIAHIEEYMEMFRSVTMFDHHKTARHKYLSTFEFIEHSTEVYTFNSIDLSTYILFDQYNSGAQMTYKHFKVNYPEELNNPFLEELIKYVSDRDLWQFNYPESKKLHGYLKLTNVIKFHQITELLKKPKNEILEIGQLYLNYVEHKIDGLIKSNMTLIEIEINKSVHHAAIVNSYLDIASELGNTIIDKVKVDIVIIYNITSHDNVSFSIRSSKHIDSTPIALNYGGGGHDQASGCSVTRTQLNTILNNKYLSISTKQPHKLVRILKKLIKNIKQRFN